LGPGFPRKGPGGQFRPKRRPRAAFFFRFSRKTRKLGENVEIVVLLQREHHFQGPRRPQYGPLGHPGAPKMTPGRARNRKRRKRNTRIFLPVSCCPLPPSFPRALRFWGSFWDLLGAPGKKGAPPVPRKRVRNVPGIVPGTPFGRRRGFWVDCGSIWGRFGVDFRSLLGRFSVDLGSVFERSGRPGVAFILLFPFLSLIGATIERSIDR
jgi:hypothetical protein